jgi:hypothetical protein
MTVEEPKAKARPAAEGDGGAATAKARSRKAPEGGGAEPGSREGCPQSRHQEEPSREPVHYEEDSMAALARLLAKHKEGQVVARKEHLRNLLRL